MKSLIYIPILLSAFIFNNCTFDTPAKNLAHIPTHTKVEKKSVKKKVVKKRVTKKKIVKKNVIKKKIFKKISHKRLKHNKKLVKKDRPRKIVKVKNRDKFKRELSRKKITKKTKVSLVKAAKKSKKIVSSKNITKKKPKVAKLNSIKINYNLAILKLSLKNIEKVYKQPKLSKANLYIKNRTSIKIVNRKLNIKKILKKYNLKVVETFSLKSQKSDPELLGPQSTIKNNPLVRL